MVFQMIDIGNLKGVVGLVRSDMIRRTKQGVNHDAAAYAGVVVISSTSVNDLDEMYIKGCSHGLW